MQISARNQLAGRVTAVRTDGLMAEVTLELGGGETLVAVITRASAEQLGLAVGAEAVAVIKSTEIMIAR